MWRSCRHCGLRKGTLWFLAWDKLPASENSRRVISIGWFSFCKPPAIETQLRDSRRHSSEWRGWKKLWKKLCRSCRYCGLRRGFANSSIMRCRWRFHSRCCHRRLLWMRFVWQLWRRFANSSKILCRWRFPQGWRRWFTFLTDWWLYFGRRLFDWQRLCHSKIHVRLPALILNALPAGALQVIHEVLRWRFGWVLWLDWLHFRGSGVGGGAKGQQPASLPARRKLRGCLFGGGGKRRLWGWFLSPSPKCRYCDLSRFESSCRHVPNN